MPPLDPTRLVPDDLSRTLAAIRLDRVRQLTPRRGVVTTPQPLADGSQAVVAPTVPGAVVVAGPATGRD